MQASIDIGGQIRAIQIDQGTAYDYEITTGRALHNDLTEITTGQSLVKVVDLIYTCLITPIRERGGVVDFRPRDVAVWINESPGIVDQFGRILTDAFVVPVDKEEKEEKKTKAAARVTTGK